MKYVGLDWTVCSSVKVLHRRWGGGEGGWVERNRVWNYQTREKRFFFGMLLMVIFLRGPE